jgi:hypothetical protein
VEVATGFTAGLRRRAVPGEDGVVFYKVRAKIVESWKSGPVDFHFDVLRILKTCKCHEHDLISVAVFRFHPSALILTEITRASSPLPILAFKRLERFERLEPLERASAFTPLNLEHGTAARL